MNAAHGTGVRIRSQQGEYSVTLSESVAALVDGLCSDDRNLFVVDEAVRDLHADAMRVIPASRMLAIAATEEKKTLDGVSDVFSFLQNAGASKRSRLVIIGGGIPQDIGVFAAHCYYRGVPCVLVPTTLLAMADSCIGAKCGLNHGSFKNQLGFFQSPERVFIATGFLATLPAPDLRSGFGEVLKLAFTAGETSFAWFEARLARVGLRVDDDIDEVLRRSLDTKRTIIEADEYEAGIRKTLNYGHTFGHALETVTGNEVPHGLAVVWGMDLANYVARAKGLLDDETFARVHALIARFYGFRTAHAYDAARIVAAMKRDKKAQSGSVGLILPRGFGRLEVIETAFDAELEGLIERYLAECDVAQLA